MKVSHGNHTCEHCAAKVATAKLCPCCGQEHGAEWLANATKVDNMTACAAAFTAPVAAALTAPTIPACGEPVFISLS